MRKINAMILVVLLVSLLASGTQVHAISPGQGVKGGKDEILSKVSTVAGNGLFDYEEGKALGASFRSPHSIVALSDGSLLVSDSSNHRIRKISNGEVTTYAGITFNHDAWGVPVGGLHNEDRKGAVFHQPSGMTLDESGNIYIADAGNHAIRQISASGAVTTLAGNGLIGNQDGKGEKAQFYSPQDVASAEDGTLYVADTLNHVIRKITPDGEVTTLNAASTRVVEVTAGSVEPAGDYKDGSLKDAKFNEPSGLVMDHKGNLYVSDTGNQLIRYIDFASNTVSTVAGDISKAQSISASNTLYAAGGYADGAALEAALNFPRGLAITEENGLLIADSLNHAIRYLVEGQLITLAGNPDEGYGKRDGVNGSNLLHRPVDVAVGQNGSVWITDSYSNLIRQFTLYELPDNLPIHDQLKVVIDQKVVHFDTEPELIRGSTMIPISAVAKELGYQWKFDPSEKAIAIQKDVLTLNFKVDDTALTITSADGQAVTASLAQAPYIKNSRVYVPIRLLSESLGLDVQWNSEIQTIVIREGRLLHPASKAKQEEVAGAVRSAEIQNIVGTAWVTKAGGTKAFRAYKGMLLQHQDHIETGAGSSVVLKTPDRGDEITISEHTKLYLSEMIDENGIKKTKLFVWSGAVWITATPLMNSNDIFKIETPDSTLNIRGTNLFVGIDPVSGAPRILISSGKGEVTSSRGNESNSPTVIMPSQQLSLFADTGSQVGIVDIQDILNHISPSIIEAMIKNKAQIDQENAEFIEQMKKSLEGGGNSNPTGLGIATQAELDRLASNLDHLIGNIVNRAIANQLVDQSSVQALINEIYAEQGGNKLDLNKVQPLELTAEEQKKQAQLKLLQQQREEQQKKQQNAQEELNKQREELLKKLEAQRKQLEEANIKAMEEAKKQAEEEFKKRLADQAAAEFEAKKKELERQTQEKGRLTPAPAPTQTPTSTPASTPTPTPDPTPTPKPDPTPKPEPEPEPVEDTTPPELTVIHPVDLLWSNTGTLDIVVRAEEGALLSVLAYEDNENAAILAEGTGAGLETNVVLQVTGLEEGSYYFTVKAVDAAANETIQELAEIRVDWTAPVIEEVNIPGETPIDRAPNPAWILTEEGARIEILYGDEVLGEAIALGDGEWTEVILPQFNEVGSYGLTVRVTDAAGNVTLTEEEYFLYIYDPGL